MSIRTIRKAGKIVGYQAIVGAGGPGKSAYFGVATYGDAAAMEKARWYAGHLAEALPPAHRPAQQGNAGGIPGLQLVEAGKRRVLVAVATFSEQGRNARRAYSTQRHGKLGAVTLALAAREAGTGVKLGLSPGAVLAILEQQLHRSTEPCQ